MDWVKFNQQLRIAVDTGKVIYGTKEVTKELLVGNPKLVVLSSTIKPLIKKQIEYYCKLSDCTCIIYPESSYELGSVCGKPFGVSALGIVNLGESGIIDVINSKDVVGIKENTRSKIKAQKKEVKEKRKSEKEQIKKEKEIKKKEEDEKPIKDDEMFKNIIKIKKK